MLRRSSFALLILLGSFAISAQTLTGVTPAIAPRGARIVVTGTGLDVQPVTLLFAASGGGTAPGDLITRGARFAEFVVPSSAMTGALLAKAGSVTQTFPFTLAPDVTFSLVVTLAASDNAHDIMKTPAGATLAVSGVTYVADRLHHRVLAVRSDGTVAVLAGTGSPGNADGAASQAQFKEPHSVAIDSNRGIIYVADTQNNVIRAISSSGVVSTLAGSGHPGDSDGVGAQAEFKQPAGIAVDAAGTIYVTDTGNSKIKSVSPAGVVQTIAGSAHEGLADGPTLQALFKQPEGLAVTAHGEIIVADTGNHAVRKIAAGVVSTLAGNGAPGMADGVAQNARFNQPASVALDDTENIIVADRLNHRVRRISSADSGVLTIAGTGAPSFLDGPVAVATFHEPSGVDVRGLIVVADSSNDAIRLIFAAPHVAAVYPTRGPLQGGNQIRIFGTGFIPGATAVSVGGVAVTTIDFVSSTELLVLAPPHDAGTVDVAVSTRAGSDALSAAYTYVPPPTITSIDPHKAKTAGGDRVTIFGTNFVAGETTVTVGGISVQSVQVVSPNSLAVTLPAHDAGAVDILVTTPGGTALLSSGLAYFAAPTIASFTPLSARTGATVAIHGPNFDNDPTGNTVTFNGVVAQVTAATATDLTVIVPSAATTGPIQVTTAGGTAMSAANFTVLTFTSISVSPSSAALALNQSRQLTATAIRIDASTLDVTQDGAWTSSDPTIANVSAGLVQAIHAGTVTVTAQFAGFTATARIVVTTVAIPPDPSTVATPLSPSTPTSFGDGVRFLYTGATPIQQNTDPNAIDSNRVAVVRGRVLDTNGQPLPGVRVVVFGQPQFGFTYSRLDGWFDLALNGGGPLTLEFTASGYLTSQRTVTPTWKQFAVLTDVVMIAVDTQATIVNFSNAQVMQVARASVVTDSDGTRRATMLFPAQTSASLVFADGTTQALSSLTVRATEYSVGPNGPKAMPAALPPSSAYTYCVELSADEATMAGADTITFTNPVVFYVENFLNLTSGATVPVGFYDRKKNVWVPSANGRIIKIMSISGGIAAIDTNGDDIADDTATLSSLGITDDERRQIAALYTAGQTLWRAQVTHFTPYDLNDPIIMAPDSLDPDQPDPLIDIQPDVDCSAKGSVISCRSQGLGEDIAITGTEFSLHYSSLRVPGRSAARTADITLTGATLPSALRSVQLTVAVAGQKIERTYTPTTNLRDTFTWDGKDAYGRTVIGAQQANITEAYLYDATYVSRRSDRIAFALPAPVPDGVPIGRPRVLAVASEDHPVIFRPWDSRGLGLGGWTLDAVHQGDLTGNTALFGDGTKRSTENVAGTLATVAGTKATSCGGFFDPATRKCLDGPTGVVVGSDGSFYFTDSTFIYKVSPSGAITSIAGNGTGSSTGDGGVARLSGVELPAGIALGTDGSVYFSEPNGQHVRRIGPDGTITRFAGSTSGAFNTGGFSGDDGPATSAKLNFPSDVAVGPDGSVYILDSGNARVRRVGTDGTITTVAGNGTSGDNGDDGAATRASINASGMAVGSDGSIYLASGVDDHIRRVRPDGVIQTIATLGRCTTPSACISVVGPRKIAIDANGILYVSDPWQDGSYSIWSVTPDARLTLAAKGDYGPGTFSAADAFFAGDNGLATATGVKFNRPVGIAAGPDSGLYIADLWNRRVRRVTTQFMKKLGTESYLPSIDGSEVYFFDKDGRHVRTMDALLGIVRYSFSYNPDGQLAAITDPDGNQTTITRGQAGTTITAPGGQQTVLTVNAAGYADSITDPGGAKRQFSYSADGLMSGYDDPRGNPHSFTFDAGGRLAIDNGPAGTSQSLSLVRSTSSATITRTSAEGRTTQYVLDQLQGGAIRRTTIDPAGLRASLTLTPDAGTTLTMPDGSLTTTTEGPDPRFGTQAPVLTGVTYRLASGAVVNASQSRSVTLTDTTNPLSIATFTEQTVINGATWRSTYTASSRTAVATSPAGRTQSTVVDSKGRVASASFGNLTPVSFAYDSTGLLTGISSGSRNESLAYDAAHRLVSSTDPLQRTTRFGYDAANRVNQQTLPDGRVITFEYDAAGNIASITPPSRPIHVFEFSPIDLISSDAGGSTRYAYNRDGQLTVVTRPDGSAINVNYDNAGRIGKISSASGDAIYQYNSTTGSLSSIIAPDGALSFAYDGILLKNETWTGPVSGTVAHSYDANLRIANENGVAYQYDADGLLTTAGVLTLRRDPQSGLLTGTTLGNLRDSWSYNGFGEPLQYNVTFRGDPLISQQYVRDDGGRITQITESIAGLPTTILTYGYDTSGRLSTVFRDGEAIATYQYDGNSNRVSRTTPDGAETATYDDQDRLLSYAGASFSYDANGNVATKTDATGTTIYTYDTLGNLRAVSLPNGTNIGYIIDARNRRVGKKVNGNLVRGWLYGDQLRPIAETDGAGVVVSTFVYGTRSNVPDYVVRGGVTYRIVTDHLGSPRYVLETTSNTLAESLSYDEFGRVLTDTNPGFIPFGFAGGLYDADTGLTKFGSRDYDAYTGRWMSKDPLGFAGGDTNLYGYVLDDPVNLVDPMGTNWLDDHSEQIASFSAGFGDALLFGFGDKLRSALGADTSLINKCSGWYTAGELTGVVASTVAGGAVGLEAAGERAAGTEFSHWIPRRALQDAPDIISDGFGMSRANGNYVSAAEHALNDPYRYRFMPRAWKNANPINPALIRQINRFPKLLAGAGAGAAYGTAGAALSAGDCRCQ